MKLSITKNTNSSTFHVIKSFKRTTRIFEKLVTIEEVKIRANEENPIIWAKNILKN